MSRHDLAWILISVVLGAIGLGACIRYQEVAFPSASLDFKLNREEVFERAQEYVEKAGYQTDEYMTAQVFSHDGEGQIFLEQTLGLEQTNRLAREWLSIWFWKVRWFKPLEKEELQVSLDPGGRIVGFQHLVLESAEGATLVQEQAAPIAEQFLQDTLDLNLTDYSPIERSSEERKARTDHTFTYRKKGFEAGEDGHYRVEVVIQGDRVGSFKEHLKVPETFSRHHKEVRSRAELLTSVASVFWFVLGAMMLVVLVQKYREGTLQWKTGLIVGGVVLIASAVGQVNSLPLIRYGYDTTQTYSSFIVFVLGMGFIGVAFTGGIICLAGTSGGAIGAEVLFARRRSPFGKLELKRVFSGGFMRSIFVGYGLGFTQLGFVTLFYIIGSRYFGIWAPAAPIDYDNTFSTVLPWIYPLLVGLVAATMEEFFFRLLAISLLIKWLGRRWIAVLLPAIVWGFLHSNYPVEPIYTRGIELSLVGILLGVVFLRFGIWTTVVSHYVYNAFLGAYPMLNSSSLYFQVSGAIVVGALLVPAIPALFGLVTGRYRQAEEEMDEGAGEEIPPARPVVETVQETAHARKGYEAYLLDRRKWVIGALFALAGVGLLVGLPVVQFGERTLELSVSRSNAVEVAEKFCGDISIDLQGFRRTAWFESSLGSDQYVHLVRHAPVARADTLASRESDPWLWHVRWFKPEEEEEIEVGVNASGEVVFFNHKIAESRAGPELEPEAAQKRVQRFVEDRFGLELADHSTYKVLEVRSEKREQRMDHHFVWERIDRKVADGEFRTTTRLQGEQIGEVRREYKAPEEFLRKLQQRDIKDVVPAIFLVVLISATLVLGGIYFLRVSREGGVAWRLPVRIGVLTGVLQLIARINELPEFFRGYDTSESLVAFLGLQAVGLLLQVAFLGLAAAVISALAFALFRQLHLQEMEPADWLRLLRLPADRSKLLLDTVLLAAVLMLSVAGMQKLQLFLRYQWLSEYLRPEYLSPPHLNGYLPLLDGLGAAFSGVLALVAFLGVFLIWQRTLKRGWALIFGIAAVQVVRSVGSADDLYHFGVRGGFNLVLLAVTIFLIVWLVRFNLLAYVIYFWADDLIGSGWGLMQTADAFYQINGVVLMAFGLAPLMLPVIAYARRRWPHAEIRATPTSG